MKNNAKALAALLLCLSLIPVSAQPGRGGGGMGGGMGGPQGPDMGGAMAAVFGENSAFTARMEMQTDGMPKGMTVGGKMTCDSGKSRYEIDLSEAAGVKGDAAAQMKAMGMDKMTVISRPDKKVSYMVYPGMEAYAEMTLKDTDATRPASDYKVETTELGKETVDGHACVKNKVVVTDDQGKKFEFTLWNATDLKKFPVKLETTQQGHKMTLLFKDVKIGKPDAVSFDPPSDYKKYDSPMTLMQQEMMKRMGGMGGPPGDE